MQGFEISSARDDCWGCYNGDHVGDLVGKSVFFFWHVEDIE